MLVIFLFLARQDSNHRHVRVAWQQGNHCGSTTPLLFPHLHLLPASRQFPSTLQPLPQSPPGIYFVSTGRLCIWASHNTDMSEPLLTETAITANIATNRDNSVTTVTIEDRRLAEVPNLPLAPRKMFFPLSFYAPPTPVPISVPPTLPATTSTDSTEYGRAIARVQLLDAFLTPSMRCTLTSMLSVMNLHTTPPDGLDTHALITRVASSEQTPDHCIKDIVDIIDKGLSIFAALGGGSTKKLVPVPESVPESTTGPRKRQKRDANGDLMKSTHRSLKIRNDCKLRDPTCQLCNSNNSGSVAHIIPYSVKDGKAMDFWRFVELFRGAKATAALKAVALAPNPEDVDNLKNVWFLCKICHDNFDRAKLAVIPDLDDLTYPYDPSVTTSVSSSRIKMFLATN